MNAVVSFHPLVCVHLASRQSGGATSHPGEKYPRLMWSFFSCIDQCFAFQRCHQFMFALSGAGCVGASSIAQGMADTLFHISLNKTSKKEA